MKTSVETLDSLYNKASNLKKHSKNKKRHQRAANDKNSEESDLSFITHSSNSKEKKMKYVYRGSSVEEDLSSCEEADYSLIEDEEQYTSYIGAKEDAREEAREKIEL